MSSYGRYYRPALKNSVDVQLQTAFNEGLWPNVIRLAAQRFKTKKDPYYETIRLCAEAQLDTVTEKSAVVVAVDALVQDKTATIDIDSIELYEWALQDAWLPVDYSKTVGALRARWAKANPSNPAVVDCLEACVREWDLVNAQQIAATLDKGQSTKHEGKTMFWNITLTHLLSTSPQCPENMAPVFAKLSRMQLEKAAAVTTTSTDQKASGRGLREEEEINLYYRAIGKDAYLKSVTSGSSPIGVIEQFDQGRKHLLLESLRALEEAEDWDNIYSLCHQALSKDDSEGKPSFLAFDMRIWKLFVEAASSKSDVESAFTELQNILQRFVSVQTSVAPMYKKNIGLALLDLTFHSPPSLLPSGSGPGKPSPRVLQLLLFIDQNLLQRATFDNVKNYVADLTFDEAKYFIDNLTKTLNGTTASEQRSLVLHTLEIRFRYLLTTCPQTLEHIPVLGEVAEAQLRCRFCSATTPRTCKTCLESIVSTALSKYKQVAKDAVSLEGLDKDPRIDLAFVASSALVKLSGLHQSRSSRLPPLSNVDVSRLMQAIVILEAQVSRSPNEVPLRLVLVQFYLLLGCASLAYQTWLPMDVKRTIQDALSPLFFDRIASISPGLFTQGKHSLMGPLVSYYTGCLREASPVKVWDAFAAGSYSSVLEMANYWDRLRRSCTIVMTVVEQRRAIRANVGRFDVGIEQSPLLSHISDDTEFVSAIDYGSFPSLESSYVAPLYELVKLGPELSTERCRLAILSEQFLDTVYHKPPKDYKPTKANEVAAKDRAYLIETYTRLHESLSALLLNPSSAISTKLTAAEHKYYSTLNFLAALLRTAVETPKTNPSPPALSTTVTGITSTLTSLRTDVLAAPPQQRKLGATASSSSSTVGNNDDNENDNVFHPLTNPHLLSTLRDAALATAHAASFVVAFNAAENARDRTGKSNLHKEVVAEAKALEALAGRTLAEVKLRVTRLKEVLGQGGWLDTIAAWTFHNNNNSGNSNNDSSNGEGDEDELGMLVREVVGEAELEEWGGKVVESWREGVKGLAQARME